MNTNQIEGENDTYPSSNPIRATLLRRSLTLTALKLKEWTRSAKYPVCPLTRKLCVKVGWHYDLSEAHALQFIRSKTSIPVPKVYCAFERKGIKYIVMEKKAGTIAAIGWEQRPAGSRACIMQQLRRIVAELGAIPVPENCRVSSINGGKLTSGTIPTLRFGPFANTQEFHDFLHGYAPPNTDVHPRLMELIELHKRNWPLRFTHGDLTPLNILIKGDEVSGIIDWETAGWLPSYWEYTSAWHANPQVLFWRKYVDMFIDPVPEALHMEQLRNDMFGHAGCVL